MGFWSASDPTCNTSCSFPPLVNQARPPCPLTYHCARPLGAVRGRIRHGGHTHASGTLQLGKEIRNVSAAATAPVTGFPARCHTVRSALRKLQPSRGKFSPAPRQRTHPQTTAVAGHYRSGTAKHKAGFLERPERRRSFQTRTNRAALKPAQVIAGTGSAPFTSVGKGL